MPLVHKPNIYIIPQGFLFQHSSTTDIPYDHDECISISIHLQCTELGSGKMDPYLCGVVTLNLHLRIVYHPCTASIAMSDIAWLFSGELQSSQSLIIFC